MGVKFQICLEFILIVGMCTGESENPAAMHARNSKLRNRDHIHDTNHIKEHYDGVVDMDQDNKLSEEETQFHYFKIHDYDNNNKLDGIELISALTHYHKEDNPENEKSLTDEDISSLVDTILAEDDGNKDGYIDYSEFILSQRND